MHFSPDVAIRSVVPCKGSTQEPPGPTLCNPAYLSAKLLRKAELHPPKIARFRTPGEFAALFVVRVARSVLYGSCREMVGSDSVPRGQRLKIVGDFVELVMAN